MPILDGINVAKNYDNFLGPVRNMARYLLDDGITVSKEGEFTLFDKDWSKEAFFVKGDEFSEDSRLRFNLYRSIADYRWHDTSPGGNVVMNPVPQYTRYSDPRRKGLLRDRPVPNIGTISNNLGMGPMYAEYIDEAVEPTFMRFGVIEGGSLIGFFTHYSDPQLTSIQTRGKHLSKPAKIIGTLGAVALTAWLFNPVGALLLVGVASVVTSIKALFVNDTSSYYQLRPTMFLYWLTVNNMVNALLMEEKLLFRRPEDRLGEQNLDEKAQGNMDGDVLANLHKLYPELFTATNGVDVAAIASKSSRRWLRAYSNEGTLFSKNSVDELGEQAIKDHLSFTDGDPGSKVNFRTGIIDKLRDVFYASFLNTAADDNFIGPPSPTDPITNAKITSEEIRTGIAKTLNRSIRDQGLEEEPELFFENARSELKDGTAFAVLRFDAVTGLSDSFSNTTAPSKVAGVVNNVSSTARSANFELGGITEDANIIQEFLSASGGLIGDAIKEGGAYLNNVALSIPSAVYGLFSGTNVIIPDHWESSASSIGTSTLTTTLISPSAHILARTMNIYIPFAMMVSAVTCRHTGRQSYTGPYMASFFQKGKFNIPLGIVERISIDRDVSNQAFDSRGRSLAFKVSMDVKDLTPIMPMMAASPILGQTILDEARTFSTDNAFTRYIRTLSGTGLEEDYFAFARNRRTRAKLANIIGARMSPAFMAMQMNEFGSTIPLVNSVINFTKGTSGVVGVAPSSIAR